MIAIEQDEMKELELALRLRQRAHGVGTAPHEVCTRILAKLEDSRQCPVSTVNGKVVRKDQPNGDAR